MAPNLKPLGDADPMVADPLPVMKVVFFFLSFGKTIIVVSNLI
tara:strand:- start:227 stop:355 length:129 start_codon:yes stop_codon:yes gene_type:complete